MVSRQQGVWQQEVNLTLTVQKGILDELTFEMPDAWTSGFQSKPEFQVLFEQASRVGTARVTIWWQRGPVNPPGEIQFRFTDSIPVTPGQPLSVPNVRLVNGESLERRLYLPDRIDGQPVLWNTDLSPLPDSAVRLEPWDGLSNYRGYVIDKDQFQAVRLPARSAIGKPRVTQADVQIHWQSSGRFTAQTTFDLQPDGLDECVAEFPPGVRPLMIAVDGHPTGLDSSESIDTLRRVRVRLNSNELPQRIRCLYDATAQRAADGVTWDLPVPRLGFHPTSVAAPPRKWQELPRDRTLWTLYHPAAASLASRAETASWDTIEASRVEHVTAVLEDAAQSSTDSTSQDLARWYTIWGARFWGSVRRGRADAPADATDPVRFEGVLQRAQQKHADIASQLKVDSEYQRLSLQTATPDLPDVWVESLPDDLQRAMWIDEGTPPRGSLKLRDTSGMSQVTVLRIAVALLGLATALGLQRWPREGFWEAMRWPAASGVVAGLAWWLWCEPSFFGWILVGLSLVVAALLR